MHIVLDQICLQCCPLTFNFNIRLYNITTACVASIDWTIANVKDSFIHAVLRNSRCNIIVIVVVSPPVMFNKHVLQDCTREHDIVKMSLVPYQHAIL